MSPPTNSQNNIKANIHLRIRRYRGPPTTLLNRQLYPTLMPRPTAFNFPNPTPRHHDTPPPPANAPVVANMGAQLTAYRAPPQPIHDAWLGTAAARGIDDDDALLARMRGEDTPALPSPANSLGQAMAQLRAASSRVEEAAERLQRNSDEMRRLLGEIREVGRGIDAGEEDEGDGDGDVDEDNEDDDDFDDDNEDDGTPAPILGLRGGEAPNNLRSDLNLMETLKLKQHFGCLPTRDDGDEEGPSLEQLRAMAQEEVLQEMTEELEELKREVEMEIERHIQLSREAERENQRERERQEALRTARAILDLRADFLGGNLRGGDVGEGGFEEDDEGEEANEDDDDEGEVEILGPDYTYVGGRVV
ncbi:MAG: hypothetical protein Q9188_004962 [Gyalolechia gomerana]